MKWLGEGHVKGDAPKVSQGSSGPATGVKGSPAVLAPPIIRRLYALVNDFATFNTSSRRI